MPRWHKVRAIAAKEVREIIRDRRTLFMAIVFPLLLYPLLIIGLIQATAVQAKRAEARKPLVGVFGGAHAPGLLDALEADKGIRVTEAEGERRPRGAAVGVVVPKDFEKKVSSGGTAVVKVLFDSADQGSIDALDKVTRIIDEHDEKLLQGRLEEEGLAESFVRPVTVEQKDLATPKQRGVFKLGKVLAFLLVTFCMMGALYPALDTVAGEKERGTLETLLSIPATRLEILSGKYVAVFAMSVASVLANFVSLSVTMLLVNNLLQTLTENPATIDFRVPTSAVFFMLPALLPLAAFFSAVSLGIAAYARSTREGQYYLAPLYAAALPLTSVALVPSAKLTYFTALVPITSISLFLKDSLMGTLDLGPTVLAIVSTCAYAALAIRWATAVFGREDVLFAAPSAEGTAPGEAKGLPRQGYALLGWAVSVILFFYLGPVVGRRLGPTSLATSFIVYVGFVLAPAFIIAVMERANLRRTFPLSSPGRAGWQSILLFIPAALFLNIVAGVLQQLVLKAPVSVSTLVSTPRHMSIEVFLLGAASIALVPAIAEELFYRGFIYRTFAARMSGSPAVLLSALLFAAAHLSPYQLLPLFTLGVVLALATKSNGTLIVPIVVHFANNLITMIIGHWFGDLGATWQWPMQAAMFVLLSAAGVFLTWAGMKAGARREPDSP